MIKYSYPFISYIEEQPIIKSKYKPGVHVYLPKTTPNNNIYNWELCFNAPDYSSSPFSLGAEPVVQVDQAALEWGQEILRVWGEGLTCC